MYTVEEKSAIDYAMSIVRSKLSKPGEAINSVQAAKDLVYLKLSNMKREAFYVLFLNSQNELLADEVMFTGTVASSEVHPREIVRRVIETNASAVILAHNHPSGCSDPSSADKRITADIVEAMSLVSCRVLDHLIVGRDAIFSFAEEDLI